ncbi:hypothetical protein GBAR_LOCUS5398 [Geodia barretti]|uniref:Uncharacterized protein n=1 Tax=Geodia barretti TaxID=519541 RepID=A0AA35RAE1_GEOBA|nr:hypothetical protein GBAR_LOCUS5398 [Geodia barretti]
MSARTARARWSLSLCRRGRLRSAFALEARAYRRSTRRPARARCWRRARRRASSTAKSMCSNMR